jgi:hypothetical protein
MLAVTSTPESPAAERQADAVAAGTTVPGPRARPFAASAVVAPRVIVVVAQAEKPDQPDDQQPDVEHAEPDHEDPPLGGH